MKWLLKLLNKLPGWKLVLLLIAFFWIVLVTIWILGGTWLDTTTCILLTVAVVVLWLIYVLVKWMLTKQEVQSIEGISDLEEDTEFEARLVNAMKSSKDSPWYLVIGPSGSGKTTLLRNSNLDFSYIDAVQDESLTHGIEGTKNCDLFFTEDVSKSAAEKAIILDTTGRYVTFGNQAQEQAEWLKLLSLLKKHRKRRPIGGLIIAIDVARLLQDGEDIIQQEAKQIRDRMTEITFRLGITFPVYLIFTKCDLIHGFGQFLGDLTSAERMQVWGGTFRSDHKENPDVLFREECKQLFQSLKERWLLKTTSAKMEDRSAVYTFPLEFDAAFQKLADFVAALFPSSTSEEDTLIFRGFYFTSGTQEGNPIDFVLKNVAESLNRPPLLLPESPRDTSEGKGYFIKDLFHRVIFPDQDLVRRTRRAERRSMFIRLGFCAASMAVLIFLVALLGVSYRQNKRLVTDAKTAAALVNQIGDNTQQIDENTQRVDKFEQFESLRKSVVQLERSALLSFLWQRQRNHVADAARRVYLLKKYGSDSELNAPSVWKVPLRRNVEIPVKVFKLVQSGTDFTPVPKIKILADVKGKKSTKGTDKKGAAVFNVKIEDGKVQVVFSIDPQSIENKAEAHELSQYELPQPEQSYEIQPGERFSSEGVRFIFSKLGRVVTIHCTDQLGKDLPGVPITIIDEQPEELRKYEETTDAEGKARFKFEAPEGQILRIRYNESETNYPEEAPEEITIQSGQSRYTVEKQLRRKLPISVIALVRLADGSTQSKSGVSVSVRTTRLGWTDNNGEWTGTSDTIPTEQNVSAEPAPKAVKVDETSSGYSIVLEYAPPPPLKPILQPQPLPSLQTVTESQQPISDVEIWVYLGEGETDSFNSVDEMAFELEGKQFSLVRLDATTDNEGKLQLPKAAEAYQLLLYHPNYWPQKVRWEQVTQPIQMVSIDQERSVEDFDQEQRDGAKHYYGLAKRAHQSDQLDRAIEYYQKAIKLMPSKRYYWGLGWAYKEKEQIEKACSQTRIGLALNLRNLDTGQSEQSQIYHNRLQRLLEEMDCP